MDWRTSSYSFANGNCVEAASGTGVAVRDTTDRDGTVLVFTAWAWAEFTGRLAAS